MSEIIVSKQTGILQSIDLNKAGIQAFCQSVLTDVEEGRVDPLDLKLYLKALKTATDIIQKGEVDKEGNVIGLRGIDTAVREEAEKHLTKEKFFTHRGVKVELAEVGTKYDFTSCNDTLWNDLTKQIEELSEKRKQRETFLKTLKASMNITDESTGGEEITIYPPVKKSTSSVKLSFK